MISKKKAKPASKKKGNQKKPKSKPSPASSKKVKKVKYNAEYIEFLTEYTKWKKESGVKSTGRGGHFHDAGRIWKDVKGKPRAIENLDVILPQYFEDRIPAQPPVKDERSLQDAIIDHGILTFNWWEGKSFFGELFGLEQWKEGYVLKIIDQSGEFRDVRSVDEYGRNVYKLISRDDKDGQFSSPILPYHEYVTIKEEEGTTYAIYKINNWFFEGKLMDEATEKVKEIRKKLQKRPDLITEPPRDVLLPDKLQQTKTKIEILKARKEDLREDVKFYKEMEMDEKLEAAKVEYIEIDDRIKALLTEI
jgi:hypothetical protein